jgi:hypothetical protein
MPSRYLRIPILSLMGLVLLAVLVPRGYAQSTDQGPAPDVGPTVLAPKKTQPAPPQPEKKPERINPDEVFNI